MDFKKLLEKKRLIIVCGLGGVGKTTLSAALALKAARNGKKSLVITVDPAKRLSTALSLKGPCPNPKKIWGEKNGGELFACLLDAKDTFDKLIDQHASPDLRDSILNNKLYQQLSMMLAGTQEYMAMEKLYSLSTKKKFDLIVVDTPPARHAIDFLRAPIKMTNMLNDSLLKLIISPSLKMGKLGSKMLGVLGRITGGSIFEDISGLMQVSLQLLDGFTTRAESIQKHLSSPDTAFVLVTAATSAMMSDALTFREELSKLGFFLDGILTNRMPPSFGNKREIEKAIDWSQKQDDILWQKAGLLLKKQYLRKQHLQKKFKPLTNSIPHSCQIPELSQGVSNFEDLHKLSYAF